MGHRYGAVQWNGQKRAYDGWLLAGLGLFLAGFIGASLLGPAPEARVSPVILVIRALGVAAFLMLTLILCIGPAARLDRRFLPFLYNRRHFGVLTFLVALGHAVLVLAWYHGGGLLNPLVSVLVINPRTDAFIGFPFELLGIAALAILFLMAATSHDFWLAQLGPTAWKTLHMLVYVAYGLIVLHIGLGALQDEVAPLYAGLTLAAVLLVSGLHLAAGLRARPRVAGKAPGAEGWVVAGPLAAIADKRAIVVTPPRGEAIAVFRDGERVMAVSNLCAHQMGPLGEGRIIDGCITCPWHGYQYDPCTGRAPAPFTERIATYRVRVEDGQVLVHPEPVPAGEARP
ncbi:MAG: ferric reductase-like transmembrane domain-containing protein [Alphaproteobacteria bacterium]|nr:ferric reductase-like transmembrane domain-containing protein [Alphaproteobacteria bacterium]